jgi:hypothetical protein
MSRRAQENIVALILLAIFIAAIVASMGYGPRARLVPVPIAALGAAFTLLLLVFQNLRPDARLELDLLEVLARKPSVDSNDQSAAPASSIPESGALRFEDLVAIGVVALLIVLILILGPYVAMFVFTAGYFIAARQYRPLRAVAYAFGYSLLCYLVFTVALDVEFEPSIVGMGLF